MAKGGFKTGVGKFDQLFLNGTELNETNISGVTATAAELNKLDGAGAVVASGTQAALIDDLGTSATGEEIATAVNAIIAALQAFGIIASE